MGFVAASVQSTILPLPIGYGSSRSSRGRRGRIGNYEETTETALAGSIREFRKLDGPQAVGNKPRHPLLFTLLLRK
ncbi:hypothetical protein ACLOJK_013210 [Asimina triloba]